MASRHPLEGRLVPGSFSAGYIVLSYFISYVGAWTTLELLHRRTAGRGFYDWYLLVGSSVAMGGVAIWCMHFVGNRALVLGHGEPELQLAYSPGYTALSFFLPILVLLPAFLTIDTRDRVRHVRVVLGGTLAGLAICGMHYVGQLGIENYHCIYDASYVVGAAVFAVVAALAAVAIFFLLRAAWTNLWWKRALCAVLLAGAVSGMRWLGVIGMRYRYRGSTRSSTATDLTKKQTVIFAIALSVTACLVLSALAVLGQQRRRRRTSAERARRVVLACAVFDHHGRLMVTPEGTLPSQKISGPNAQPAAQEAFSVGDRVFQWALRASRDWRVLTDLVPCMRHHLHDGPSQVGLYPTVLPSADTATIDLEHEEQAIRFKEMFCTAAADLAKQIGEPLEDVGVLYDDVVVTGTQESCRLPVGTIKPAKAPWDLESALAPAAPRLGPGQLLLLVRRTDKTATARLQSHGFRFASLPLIVDALADALQVSANDVTAHVDRMRCYASEDHLLGPGVHVACFAIRASVGGSFDVLVPRDARTRLPSRPLGTAALEDWHRHVLRRLEGHTVASCLDWARQTAAGAGDDDDDGDGDRGNAEADGSEAIDGERTFARQLKGALTGLVEDVAEPLFQRALLVTETVQATCRGAADSYFPGRATIIAFRLLVPIHARPSEPGRNVFVPLSLFRCQQYANGSPSDHATFVRKVQREFAPVVESTTQSTVVYRPATAAVPRLHPKPASRRAASSGRRSWWSGLSSLERRWSDICTPQSPTPPKTALEARSWGGILVSQEVNVNVDAFPLGHVYHGSDPDGMAMGSSGMASADVEDAEIFVDRLLASVVAR